MTKRGSSDPPTSRPPLTVVSRPYACTFEACESALLNALLYVNNICGYKIGDLHFAEYIIRRRGPRGGGGTLLLVCCCCDGGLVDAAAVHRVRALRLRRRLGIHQRGPEEGVRPCECGMKTRNRGEASMVCCCFYYCIFAL